MKEKTKQTSWDYTRILLVFAITGTTSSFAPKYLMPLTGLEEGWPYYLVYFLLITPVYMVLLLIVAFLFGKFDYFYEKEKKIIHWLFRIKSKPTQPSDS